MLLKKLSRTGLIFDALYIIFVIFWIARAEQCFGSDGLFCNVGYLVPGIPWSLSVGLIPEGLLPESGTLGSNLVFFTILVLSVLFNLLLVYRYGRLLGNTVSRRRA